MPTFAPTTRLPCFADVAAADWQDWRWQMRQAIVDGETLAAVLRLPAASAAAAAAVAAVYPARATPYYLSLAASPSAADPIVRQILPTAAELAADGLAADGLGEQGCSPLPGVLHRYPDRLLVLAGRRCAAYCRHCFRKRRWQADETDATFEIAPTIAYLHAHPEVREVIISGGEPLLAEDDQVLEWVRRFAELPTLEVVRLASRVPAVLPQRLTQAFARRLAAAGPVWLMTQFNHPLEVTAEAAAACGHLLRAGIPVLSQTVLLRGVNDQAETLAQLFRALVAIKVKPHYLFHGDPVAGTGHFRTGIAAGLELLAALRGQLSSLAMPRFAIDLPENGGKIVLEADSQAAGEDGSRVFRAIDGREIAYPE